MRTAPAGFVAEAATLPAHIPETTRPRVAFPPDSCDAHVHIFGPQWEYSHVPNPIYIANDASVEDLRKMLGVLGCQRAVIVQPSYYGTDNRCTIDAVKAGNGDFRGIVALSDGVTDSELEDMHQAGVRGARLHVQVFNGALPFERMQRVADRIKSRDWHLQLYFNAAEMPQLDELLVKLPVQVSIDHFGYLPAAEGIQSPGFQMLLRLAQSGRAWFKLSAPYRQSKKPPLFEDVGPLARALYEIVPDQCVWGTDWPHVSNNKTGIIRVPNDGELADALIGWLPDAADRKRVLVDNPARLYGF